jgi:peptidyl-prolyl cis-trans isomerase C
VGAEKMAELRGRALASVIDEELEYQEGVRRKIVPTDAELKAAWTATVTRNGGERGFAATMARAGLTEEGVRRELARRIVVERTTRLAVLDRCSVTPEEARRFFIANPNRFVEPEQMHVLGITFGVDPSSPREKWQEARRRAEEVRRALDGGASFAELARTHSTDPSRDKGGDMGFVHDGTLASPFDQAVKALRIGTPSGVIESLYGYHILLVSEIRPPQRKTFEQVGDGLVTDLSAKRCAEQQDAWLASLRASARIEMLDGAQ